MNYAHKLSAKWVEYTKTADGTRKSSEEVERSATAKKRSWPVPHSYSAAMAIQSTLIKTGKCISRKWGNSLKLGFLH